MFNKLYLAIKEELSFCLRATLPGNNDLEAQLLELWRARTNWGLAHPVKRKALAQRSICDLVTQQSRSAGVDAAEILSLIARVSKLGVLTRAPPALAGALFEAMAAMTMDFMAREPERAEIFCASAFKAVWACLPAARSRSGRMRSSID